MYWGTKFFRLTERKITPRRLSAAKRFLSKERDRYALFAGEVAAEQPSPEERINRHDDAFEDGHQRARDKRSQDWREARKCLAELSPDFREMTLTIWNRKRYPADPVFLLSLIRRVCSGEVDPAKELQELERLKELSRAKGWRND